MAKRGLDQGEVDGVLLRVAATELAHDADSAEALDRGAVVLPSECGERLGDRERDVADPLCARIAGCGATTQRLQRLLDPP
jgi:hypothetical protein